jgi:hypothetical protein
VLLMHSNLSSANRSVVEKGRISKTKLITDPESVNSHQSAQNRPPCVIRSCVRNWSLLWLDRTPQKYEVAKFVS